MQLQAILVLLMRKKDLVDLDVLFHNKRCTVGTSSKGCFSIMAEWCSRTEIYTRVSSWVDLFGEGGCTTLQQKTKLQFLWRTSMSKPLRDSLQGMWWSTSHLLLAQWCRTVRQESRGMLFGRLFKIWSLIIWKNLLLLIKQRSKINQILQNMGNQRMFRLWWKMESR